MSIKPKTLALFLKQAREKAEISQRQVADELGYQSAQFISNWERGISTPPMKTLKHLGELYRVSAEDLYEIMVEDTLRRVEADLHKEFFTASSACLCPAARALKIRHESRTRASAALSLGFIQSPGAVDHETRMPRATENGSHPPRHPGEQSIERSAA